VKGFKTFLCDAETWVGCIFGLLVLTQAWLLVGFVRNPPDAPILPQQQHATPSASATPPRSF
jgi:hypothetical protein